MKPDGKREGDAEALPRDGRLRRSARSRERIVDALFELILAGEPQPTGQRVADRAGVGLRTVFRHFADMESLYASMNARAERMLAPYFARSRVEGPLATRIEALVAQRMRLFERITPLQKADRLQRWRSPVLQESYARFVAIQRSQLAAALPEIAALPAERRQMLELVTSFEAWDRLRGDQRLGAPRAAACVRDAIEALLRDA